MLLWQRIQLSYVYPKPLNPLVKKQWYFSKRKLWLYHHLPLTFKNCLPITKQKVLENKPCWLCLPEYFRGRSSKKITDKLQYWKNTLCGSEPWEHSECHINSIKSIRPSERIILGFGGGQHKSHSFVNNIRQTSPIFCKQVIERAWKIFFKVDKMRWFLLKSDMHWGGFSLEFRLEPGYLKSIF